MCPRGHLLPGGEAHSSAVCVAAAGDWPGQVGTQPPERTPGKKEEVPQRLHRATRPTGPGGHTERKPAGAWRAESAGRPQAGPVRFSLLESERSPARFLGNQETRRQGGGGLRMAVPASHSSPFQ